MNSQSPNFIGGNYIFNFFMTFFPTFLIVYFITENTIRLGINIVFFLLSVLLGTMINFFVDFFVGVICFYSESIWGVNVIKEILIALLSGSAIPLAFFPDALRKIINFLPFQAIYNTPLQILINKNYDLGDYASMLLRQVIWLIITFGVTRVFWNIAKKTITVNGG